MKNILLSMLVVLGLSFATVSSGKDWKQYDDVTVDDFRDLMKDAEVVASHFTEDNQHFYFALSHPDYGLLFCMLGPTAKFCQQAGNPNFHVN